MSGHTSGLAYSGLPEPDGAKMHIGKVYRIEDVQEPNHANVKSCIHMYLHGQKVSGIGSD